MNPDSKKYHKEVFCVKKILATLLALCMVLGACSALAEVTYPVETSTTLTIWKQLDGSIADGGYTTSMDTPGFKAWCEKSGIQVELKEFADATSLVLSLNGATTLPDMFMFNAGRDYNGGVAGLIADEMVQEIEPAMLEQYAPDYWAYINKPIYMNEITQLDGKMYYLAGHIFEEKSPYRYWRGLFYRQDILDAIGRDVPQTIDEFYDTLVAMKEHGVETPFVFQGKTDLRDCLKNGELTSAFGLVNTAEYQVDGQWHFGAYEPEYKDVLAFMKKLYDEGLISVDYLSMEEATSRAMFCTGEAGVMYGNNSRLNTYLSSLEEGSSMVGGYVIHAEDQDHAMFSYADPMTTSDDITFISADCKNVELCMELYNYLYTEEGNMIRNYGIEGESYTIGEDGKPQYTDLVLHNPDGHSMDGVARSYALINWPGIHANDQLAMRHPEGSQIVAYERWSGTDHDEHVVIHTAVLDEYLDEYTDLWTDINLYIDECRAKFISGEMSIENDFDAYIDTLKSMGMDRVCEIKQITLDAHNAALAE